MTESAQLLRGNLVCLILLSTISMTSPAAPSSVYLEELTSPELQTLIDAGTRTVLVPIGGTEQNGAHMVLGKHNVRVRLLAGKIAQALGDAVVAPVIAYVPEGSVEPPAGHMRFAGTISVPGPAFEAVLDATARSFKRHGFQYVVFLGDHGGYQKLEIRVADRLNRLWAADPSCRVQALTAYYLAAQKPFETDLEQRGFTPVQIGTHAGLADTALALAVDPALVRQDLQANATPGTTGVSGDPRPATAALGQLGVQRIVAASVAAIRKFTGSASDPIAPKEHKR